MPKSSKSPKAVKAKHAQSEAIPTAPERSETVADDVSLAEVIQGGVRAIVDRVGKTSGLGYTVDHVQPGRGFSAHEYSSKEMPNGHTVSLVTFFPGPFDNAAGYASDIEETYKVWVGWEEYSEEGEELYDSPPLSLPAGATGWGDRAWDGPRDWFAKFKDGELAEAFALSLPPITKGSDILPISRTATSDSTSPKTHNIQLR